jgi:hypothetical protein
VFPITRNKRNNGKFNSPQPAIQAGDRFSGACNWGELRDSSTPRHANCIFNAPELLEGS